MNCGRAPTTVRIFSGSAFEMRHASPLCARYVVPHAAHVRLRGGVLPAASLTPHSHIQPVMRPGLPTISA